MMNPEPALNPAEHLRDEIARLREKRSKSQDPDVYDALDMKIAHLEERLRTLEKKKEMEPVEEAPEVPPTLQQLSEAEGFVRQARVEKMRGNAKGATDLLRRAAGVAPTAPAVLEALGDDLVEQRQRKEALMVYKKAVKLDPKNVGLERKYAMLVLGSSQTVSFEQAMHADWSETPFISANDHVASPLAATLLTLFVPGMGHLVLGKTTTGISIMAAWGVCCFWIALMAKDVVHLLEKLKGVDPGHTNYAVLLPMIAMAGIYVFAVNGLRAPKRSSGRGKVDRPKPPVNLPFD